MGEKISEDALFNAAVQMYLAFDERMGRPKFKGLPNSDSPAYKNSYAVALAEDFAKFYQTFTTSLDEQLQSGKVNQFPR